MLRPAIEIAVLTAIAGQQAAPAPVFAPPEGVPLIVTVERTQRVGDEVLRFSATHSLVFAREAGGYRATMTLEASGSDAPGPGSAFDRAMTALKGRPIAIHLDADGAVRSIDDLAAHWTAFIGAMRDAAAPEPIAGAAVARIEALPPEVRQSMLTSAFASLIRADIAGRGPSPSERVPIAPRPPYRPVTVAEGSATVERVDDLLVARTAADFAVTDPSGTNARMTIDDAETIDPMTGMLVSARSIRATTLADGTLQEVSTTTRVARR